MTNVAYAYFKSKDEEQAVFMAGSDIGFTKWDNELKEALLRAPITFRQYKIFDAIHRLTLGWNKESDHITNTQLGKMTEIHHTHVCKVRKELEEMNMIFKLNNEVAINQNHHDWSFNKSLAKPANENNPNQQALAETANNCEDSHKTLSETDNENKPNQLNITESANGCQNSYTLAETANMSLAKSANESLAESAKHQRKERQERKNPPVSPLPTTKSKFDPVAQKPDNVSADVWADWVEHRREIRHPLTPTTCKRIRSMLENHVNPDAVINLSIERGWQGLFPEKITEPAKAKSTFDTSRLTAEQRQELALYEFLEGR